MAQVARSLLGLRLPASSTEELFCRDQVRVPYSTSVISALFGPCVVDMESWPAAASWM